MKRPKAPTARGSLQLGRDAIHHTLCVQDLLRGQRLEPETLSLVIPAGPGGRNVTAKDLHARTVGLVASTAITNRA